MAEPLAPKDLLTIEDLAISSMWENTTLGEELERKGVLTRQELHAALTDLPHPHPEGTRREGQQVDQCDDLGKNPGADRPSSSGTNP